MNVFCRAIFTANISKPIMRDILSLSLSITCQILIVSRQTDPPTGTDDPMTSSLSLSLSLKEIFFINEIFNFYLTGPGRDLSTLSDWGDVLMAHSHRLLQQREEETFQVAARLLEQVTSNNTSLRKQ